MVISGPGIWALVFGLGAAWSKGIALPTDIHEALNLSQRVVRTILLTIKYGGRLKSKLLS